jgi:ATPase subunit of ABC transporter with duplicated ATPase domains
MRNTEFLEGVVSQFRGAVIVVSHDEHFLVRCQLNDELVVRSRR